MQLFYLAAVFMFILDAVGDVYLAAVLMFILDAGAAVYLAAVFMLILDAGADVYLANVFFICSSCFLTLVVEDIGRRCNRLFSCCIYVFLELLDLFIRLLYLCFL